MEPICHYCYDNGDWGGESQAAPTPYKTLLHYSISGDSSCGSSQRILPQPHSQAIGEMAWQIMRVQTVTSTARKLAVPIKFITMSHDSS